MNGDFIKQNKGMKSGGLSARMSDDIGLSEQRMSYGIEKENNTHGTTGQQQAGYSGNSAYKSYLGSDEPSKKLQFSAVFLSQSSTQGVGQTSAAITAGSMGSNNNTNTANNPPVQGVAMLTSTTASAQSKLVQNSMGKSSQKATIISPVKRFTPAQPAKLTSSSFHGKKQPGNPSSIHAVTTSSAGANNFEISEENMTTPSTYHLMERVSSFNMSAGDKQSMMTLSNGLQQQQQQQQKRTLVDDQSDTTFAMGNSSIAATLNERSPKSHKNPTKFPPINKNQISNSSSINSTQSSQANSNSILLSSSRLSKAGKITEQQHQQSFPLKQRYAHSDSSSASANQPILMSNNSFKVTQQQQQQAKPEKGLVYQLYQSNANPKLIIHQQGGLSDLEIKGVAAQESLPIQKYKQRYSQRQAPQIISEYLTSSTSNSSSNYNNNNNQHSYNQNYNNQSINESTLNNNSNNASSRENHFVSNGSIPAGTNDSLADLNRSSSTPLFLKKDSTKSSIGLDRSKPLYTQQPEQASLSNSQIIAASDSNHASVAQLNIHQPQYGSKQTTTSEQLPQQLHQALGVSQIQIKQQQNSNHPSSSSTSSYSNIQFNARKKSKQEDHTSNLTTSIAQNESILSKKSTVITSKPRPSYLLNPKLQLSKNIQLKSEDLSSNTQEQLDQDFEELEDIINTPNRGVNNSNSAAVDSQTYRTSPPTYHLKGAASLGTKQSQQQQQQLHNSSSNTKQRQNSSSMHTSESELNFNETISRAPLNPAIVKQKSTIVQENSNNLSTSAVTAAVLSQNSSTAADLNKKKPKKPKKKRSMAIAQGQSIGGSTGGGAGTAFQSKGQLQQVGRYDHLPKEIQRISQYADFLRAVNFSNQIEVIPTQKPSFKFYVGKGNNSIVIKNCIKQRWWLQLVLNKDQMDSCHIVWTQLRNNDVILALKPYCNSSKSAAYLQPWQQQQSQQQLANLSLVDVSTDSLNNNNNNDTTNMSMGALDAESQNGGDSSDSECSEKQLRSLSSRIKKANSLNSSVSDFSSRKATSASLSIASTSATMNMTSSSSTGTSVANSSMQSSQVKERSLTPSTRSSVPQAPIMKAQATYNANSRRIFHPTDFKRVMEVQPSLDSDLRNFFAVPLVEQFSQAAKDFEVVSDSNAIRMHNHLENNWNLSNKKALFYNMRNYYNANMQNPFDYIPLTFHIKDGINDPEYARFLEHFKQKEDECAAKEKQRIEFKNSTDKAKQAIANTLKKPRNIWIIKPGENTNRGTGITVLSEIDQITNLLAKEDLHPNGKQKTYIVQKYLDNPLLYNKRKFDIRCYLLVSCVKGRMKAYWYQDGYIRTSCKEYNCKSLTNKMIHLTNDAVQNKCEDYGKYEPGNKLSYTDLQRYLDLTYTEQKVNFQTVVYPRMKSLALDCVKSTFLKMDPQRREMSFEVFGLDYMIDEDLRTWLIEVNTNPCLELSSPLLARIIPAMVENAFRIAIDPIFGFPQVSDWTPMQKKTYIPDAIMENNKFDLVFDEAFDGPQLRALYAQYNEQQQDIIIEEEEESDEEIEDEQ